MQLFAAEFLKFSKEHAVVAQWLRCSKPGFESCCHLYESLMLSRRASDHNCFHAPQAQHFMWAHLSFSNEHDVARLQRQIQDLERGSSGNLRDYHPSVGSRGRAPDNNNNNKTDFYSTVVS